MAHVRMNRLMLRRALWSPRHLSSSVVAPEKANAVIVGGGVIGTSVAYSLAKAGMSDVVLLEARNLASSGSSTFHSAGLMTSSDPVHRLKPILANSVALYRRLHDETGEEVKFVQSGTLRLATNQSRLDEFELYTARDYYKVGDECHTQLLNADEVKQLCPHIDTSKVMAALYTTGDGFVNPVDLSFALSVGARKYGAKIVENCPALGIERTADGQWAIHTDMGTIHTQHVINAAGLWARDFGQMTGLDLPLVHVEHQWGVTGALRELEGLKDMPVVIDHEAPFYMRQEGESIVFGAYEGADKVTMRNDWTVDGMPKDGNTSVEPVFNRIAEQWARAGELVPMLKKVDIQAHSGVFAMTPDHFPMVGPVAGLNNYWMAAGAFDGVSTAGGLGQYLADWIVNEEPPFESFDHARNILCVPAT